MVHTWRSFGAPIIAKNNRSNHQENAAITTHEETSSTIRENGPAKKTAESFSEKIRKSEESISKLRTHSEKGTCPKTLRYNARVNITPDDDFKRDIALIRKNAQQKYLDALIKFHYRRVERNKIELNRIKQLQSRKSSDAKQSRDKAHSVVSDPNAINHTEKIENIQKGMNELKQMMLDVEKNENKEFKVNLIPMCLLCLRITLKGKRRTKSAICTIKRHERRKKRRRDIYQKKKKQEKNKRYIKNLSNLELTQAQINLLLRGLKFIPTSVTNEGHIRTQLLNGFKAFARRMRVQYIFYGHDKEPHSFHVKSNWEPPVQTSVTLESYLEEVKTEIAEVRISEPKYNLPINYERQALKELKQNNNIIVKKADKGTSTDE